MGRRGGGGKAASCVWFGQITASIGIARKRGYPKMETIQNLITIVTSSEAAAWVAAVTAVVTACPEPQYFRRAH